MQVLDVLRKEISIHNVVCTSDLKQSVNIESFNEYKYLRSNLNLYRCGYVKDNKMIGLVTVFASGKMISIGTKSPEQAYEELQKAGNILKKYKLIGSFKITHKVQNMVARFDFGKKISLEKLARTMPKSMYEPEQFAGLIFRIQDSHVALIFASGKVILIGAKTISELNRGLFEVERWINY